MNLTKKFGVVRPLPPDLFFLLLCLVVSFLLYPKSADAAEPYITSLYSLEIESPPVKWINYGAVTNKLSTSPAVTRVNAATIQLHFSVPIEIAVISSEQGGMGASFPTQISDNFSITGTSIQSPVNVLDLSQGNQTDRKTFTKIQISANSNIPAGASVSYAMPDGNSTKHSFAIPTQNKLVSAFSAAIPAANQATLQSLVINGATLAEAFTPTVYDYSAVADAGSVTVNATASDNGAVNYSFNGSSGNLPTTINNLSEGDNKITLTTSSGLQYKLNVIKRPPGMNLGSAMLSAGGAEVGKINLIYSTTPSFLKVISSQVGAVDLNVTLASGSAPVARATVKVNNGTVTAMNAEAGNMGFSAPNLPLVFWNNTLTVTLYDAGSVGKEYYFNVQRIAGLDDLSAFAVVSGQARPLELTPSFSPNLGDKGDIVNLETVLPQDVPGNVQFYVRPFCSDAGTQIKVNGVLRASGQNSQLFGPVDAQGLCKIAVTLEKTAGGSLLFSEGSTPYNVIIRKDFTSAPPLSSLKVSSPQGSESLINFVSVTDNNDSCEWVISKDEAGSKTYYIEGGMTRHYTGESLLLDGVALEDDKFSKQVTLKDGEEKKVVIKTVGEKQATRTYTLQFVNAHQRIGRVYIGLEPELLAKASNPANITIGTNGSYSFLLKDGTTVGRIAVPGSAVLAANQEYDIPWAVYPADVYPSELKAIKFSRNVQALFEIAETRNTAGTGGVLKVKRKGHSSYQSDEVENGAVWDSVYIFADVDAARLGSYLIQDTFSVGNSPVYPPVTFNVVSIEPLKPIEIWPLSEHLPMIAPYFPEAHVAIQDGQSLVIPFTSRGGATYGQYCALPSEIRQKYPYVRNHAFFGHIGDNKLMGGSLPYWGDLSKIEIEFDLYDPPTFSFDETTPYEIKKGFVEKDSSGFEKSRLTAKDLIGLPHPSTYLTLETVRPERLGIAEILLSHNLALKVTAKPGVEFPKLGIGIRILGTSKVLKEKDCITVYPISMTGGAVQTQRTDNIIGASILTVPRVKIGTYTGSIKAPGTSIVVMTGGASNSAAVSCVNAMTSAAITSISALLDMVTAIAVDLTKADIHVMWQNLKANQYAFNFQTHQPVDEKWAVAFSPRVTSFATPLSVSPAGWLFKYASSMMERGNLKKTTGYLHTGMYMTDVVKASDKEVDAFLARYPSYASKVDKNRDLSIQELGLWGDSEGGMPLYAATTLVLQGSKKSSTPSVLRSSSTVPPPPMGTEGENETPSDWVTVSPFTQVVSDDYTVVTDNGGDAAIEVILDGLDVEFIVPEISYAQNITVEDADGNKVSSDFSGMLSASASDQEKDPAVLAAKRGMKRASSVPAPSRFVVKFTVPSDQVQDIEVKNIYYKQSEDPDIKAVTLTEGNGVNGGYVLEEPLLLSNDNNNGGGGGCNSGFFGLAALALHGIIRRACRQK